MTAQAYNIISISSFVLCGFTVLLSIFLFFKFKIRSVVGELSGKTAERQVEEIRKQNRTVKNRASILMDESKSHMADKEISDRTEPIQSSTDATQSEATTVLNETTLLINDEDENATVVLSFKQLEEYITVIDVMEIHTQEVITE